MLAAILPGCLGISTLTQLSGRVGDVPVAILLPYILVEFLAFYLLATWLGLGWAILVLIIAFFGGLFLAAYEMRSISRALATNPNLNAGRAAGNYGLVGTGALLLALPGVVTTFLGLLFIIPPTRALIRRFLARKFREKLEALGMRSYRITETRSFTYGRFDDPSVVDEEEIKKWRDNLDPKDFQG